jgi:hypothetical protein
MSTSLITMSFWTLRVQRETATRPLEFLGGLLNSHLLPTTKQNLSSNNICARQAAPLQDTSDQNQELSSRGTNHQRPLVHLSQMSPLRSGGPGQLLGTRRRRVDRLGIPGNVLCMPMRWIRTNVPASDQAVFCKGGLYLPVVSSSLCYQACFFSSLSSFLIFCPFHTTTFVIHTRQTRQITS